MTENLQKLLHRNCFRDAANHLVFFCLSFTSLENRTHPISEESDGKKNDCKSNSIEEEKEL